MNSKTSHSRDHHHEYDVRHQYPQTVHRPRQAYQTPPQSRRSWPPSPRAEDESLALAFEHKPEKTDTSSEEAQSRGAIDQQPIILDVDLPPPEEHTVSPAQDSDSDSNSSSESSGPTTPIDSAKQNQDQRYVYIPKEGIEIPLTYDEQRKPVYAGPSTAQNAREPSRGRTERPRVETGFVPHGSLQADTPVRDRASSPYTFVPQPKPKEVRIGGEHLLSPEMISPNMSLPQTLPRELSRRRQAPGEPDHGPQPSSSTIAERENASSKIMPRPSRPAMVRHSSTAAYSREPTTPSNANDGFCSNYASSSEEEAYEGHHRSSIHRDWPVLGRESPVSPRKACVPVDRDRTPRPDRRLSSGLRPDSPPPRARSSSDLRALPSQSGPLGVGLQAANVLLQQAQHDGRRASPRASPVVSPVNSPTRSRPASPPGTPPAERRYRSHAAPHTRHIRTPHTPLCH